MPAKKNNLFLDILFSVVVPSIILMKFSSKEQLGPLYGLLIALAFPLGWAAYDLIKSKTVNFIAALGLVSVLLTGGIGLFELDNKWLAIKEAMVPAIFGIIVFASGFGKSPLVRKFLLDTGLMKTQLINQRLDEVGKTQEFNKRIRLANLYLSLTFAFSSVMNFILAKWLVTAPTGSEEFNDQLGQLTLLSYPMIAIPAWIMMVAILFYIWRTLTQLTGLDMEQLIEGD
ncbi:VC0807 family protein [Pseudoalteromonas ulvae]|uniref:MFS transporter n=1 Tax=Pseudoalteromonas ulvae TaxID=107327 RepID=A0A244CLE5_PSEDV|nr:VC0807 family protein [Pseudoalteromonas ulvae]OUL56440.1 MFS transporter [Pseudoalteromonas ulvae]